MTTAPTCALCGEPMPPGEQMFKYHGSSGPCPKPPLPKPDRSHEIDTRTAEGVLDHLKSKMYDVKVTTNARQPFWRVEIRRSGFDIMAQSTTLLEACKIALQYSQRDEV